MKGNPLFIHACHCLHCQRETGSAFALNILIEASSVRLLSGAVEVFEIPTQSGRGQKISRCKHCKTALWSNYAGMGQKVNFVKAGTTDVPGRFSPDIHIYTEHKAKWLKLSDRVPAVPGFYKPRDIWPGQSLNRLQALQDDT